MKVDKLTAAYAEICKKKIVTEQTYGGEGYVVSLRGEGVDEEKLIDAAKKAGATLEIDSDGGEDRLFVFTAASSQLAGLKSVLIRFWGEDLFREESEVEVSEGGYELKLGDILGNVTIEIDGFPGDEEAVSVMKAEARDLGLNVVQRRGGDGGGR